MQKAYLPVVIGTFLNFIDFQRCLLLRQTILFTTFTFTDILHKERESKITTDILYKITTTAL